VATITIDIGKTPTQLAELLLLASQGTEVIIAQGDRTLARLVPVAQQNPRVGNLNPGSISTTEDFDAPLPDEFWMGDE
jgi:antitoxin (DNA-binding transcriptional repressor) of toxin-antitoxin stability system